MSLAAVASLPIHLADSPDARAESEDVVHRTSADSTARPASESVAFLASISSRTSEATSPGSHGLGEVRGQDRGVDRRVQGHCLVGRQRNLEAGERQQYDDGHGEGGHHAFRAVLPMRADEMPHHDVAPPSVVASRRSVAVAETVGPGASPMPPRRSPRRARSSARPGRSPWRSPAGLRPCCPCSRSPTRFPTEACACSSPRISRTPTRPRTALPRLSRRRPPGRPPRFRLGSPPALRPRPARRRAPRSQARSIPPPRAPGRGP